MRIQCEGWWQQEFLGKQAMEPLSLDFRDGAISGSGRDVVGPFTMTGMIREGSVAIDKQYVGQHSARYLGQFDGEGSMQGTWHIGTMTGPWMIYLRGKNAAGADVADVRIVGE
ncbi:MAG: hypothetical protein HKN47_05685 [Pirellulaceae bacterium]|nr:hypothetical protein [Pirellulaceae bacterium]